MGIFTDGYVRHQYPDWLLTTVANVLDDSLSISSAGLLRDGAIAWVEVSVPESITTPEGVSFRPNLLATTSFDGSIATTFKRTVTDTVCDNTRDLALSEAGQQLQGQALPPLPAADRRSPGRAGHGPHPGRGLRRRGRPALRDRGDPVAVAPVPRQPTSPASTTRGYR